MPRRCVVCCAGSRSFWTSSHDHRAGARALTPQGGAHRQGRCGPSAAKPREPLLEPSDTFLERLLFHLLAGARGLGSLLLVLQASANQRALLGAHLRPDATRTLDLLANLVIGARLLLGPLVLGGVAYRHG